MLKHTGSRVDGLGIRNCICEKDDAIRTSGVMSPPGTIPIDNRALPVSYASDTVPFEHWVMATMTQRSDASFNASIRSERWGAFPAPKVSRTTPWIGGLRNARTISAEIPGNRRSVAIDKL